MPSRSRRRRTAAGPSEPAATGSRPRREGRGNAARAARVRPEAEEPSLLDRVGDWFEEQGEALSDRASEAWQATRQAGEAAGVAAEAGWELLTRREGDTRTATVDADAASRALQAYGPEGARMLEGVDFAEDQEIGLSVNRRAGEIGIHAEDLRLDGLASGAFTAGPTRLTGMRAGGSFLDDDETLETWAHAETVTSTDFAMALQSGPVRADALELSGFRASASYLREAEAMAPDSATTGSFEVDEARVRGLRGLDMGADEVRAEGIAGGLDVDGGAGSVEAAALSAEGFRSEALGGLSIGHASVNGFGLAADLTDPEAVQATLEAEAADLADVLTPHASVAAVSADGLQIRHDTGSGGSGASLEQATAREVRTAGGASAARATLTGGRLEHRGDTLSGEATRATLLGVRDDDVSIAGVAFDEARVAQDATATEARAAYTRLDDARVGDGASVRVAAASGLSVRSEGERLSAGLRKGHLLDARARGEGGQADVDRVDLGETAVAHDAAGLRADLATAGATGVHLHGEQGEARVAAASLQGARLAHDSTGTTVGADRATLDDVGLQVRPGQGAGSGPDLDLARAVETGGSLVDRVDGRAAVDLRPGRYADGEAHVRPGTRATADVRVRDGAFTQGTRLGFSRDVNTPWGTDLSGARVDERGQVVVDVGVPLLGRLFDFEVGVDATDRVNEALGRGDGAAPTAAEIAAWAAERLRSPQAGPAGPDPVDPTSVQADLSLGLRPGRLDAGAARADLSGGDNAVRVQASGLDQVVASFSRLLASRLGLDLGEGRGVQAGAGTVEDGRLTLDGQTPEGALSGTIGRVLVEDLEGKA